MTGSCESCGSSIEWLDGNDAATCGSCGLANQRPADHLADVVPLRAQDHDEQDHDDDHGADPKASQSTLLVGLALDLFDLGVTDTGEVFAVERGAGNIALQLRGGRTSLRATLAARFFAVYGKAPTASAQADALGVLEGMAAQVDPVELPLRVARHGDAVVVDLGGPDGRAVVIDRAGWQIVDRSPVLFRRTNLTLPLPAPVSTSTPILELLDGLNADPEQLKLVVGWLLAALVPEIPHPVLAWFGLQGTGKSTAGRIVGSIVDPTAAPLRSAPRHEDQWSVAASGSWVVVLDNLSGMQPWLSDALCRAVTGDGAVKRQLYTDTDVSVLKFRRCVMLTSIDAGALRGDLAERLLPVELERIDTTERRTEADIIDRFEQSHPELLGALFDLLVKILAALPSVTLEEMPRMADFAKVLAALDQVTGWNTLAPYLNVGDDLAADVVEADPVAQAITALARAEGRWSGTAADLLKKITNVNAKLPKGWPTQPNALSGRVKRVAPALRAVGVIAEQGDGRHRRTWTIEASRVSSSPSSPSSPPAPLQASRRDDPQQTIVTRDDPRDGRDDHHLAIVTAEPAPRQGCDDGDGRDGLSPPDSDPEQRSLYANEPPHEEMTL